MINTATDTLNKYGIYGFTSKLPVKNDGKSKVVNIHRAINIIAQGPKSLNSTIMPTAIKRVFIQPVLSCKAQQLLKANNQPAKLPTLACYIDSGCYFLQSPITSSLSCSNILLSTLFSNALNLCSSLDMRYQISHPYKPRKSNTLKI